jgi:farnesyl diphosphate synthase
MELFDLFEQYLQTHIPKYSSFHPFFNEALAYSLKAGGKRFRPLLLLSVVNAYNPLLINNAMPVALALEFLHTYSLIHDDLPAMDNANLRRGKPTLHKKFDEVSAILIGDVLNTHSFNLIANAPLSNDVKIKLIQDFSLNAGLEGMVIGQAIDCYFENKKLSFEEVKFLHIHKTAKLIAVSLKMGGIIVDLDKALLDKLYDFGIKIGLLFQIQDDIIDQTCSIEEAGKDISNDKNKNSFINLIGLKDSINEANKLAKECENILQNLDTQLNKTLSVLLKKYLFRHNKD